MAEQAQGYELQWDSPIQSDSEFLLLPDGEYDFQVLKLERARHTPGENGKLPPCNKAVLQIQITAPDGRGTQVRHTLFLHSSTEGLLCAFFAAIGQRKHNERLVMNWNKVPGARGRCKVTTRTWIGRNDEEMQSNEIARFLYPDDDRAAATTTQAAASRAPLGTTGRTAATFEPGRF
jgi:hypothetical protein